MWNDIEALAFDADDTLWDCQSHFDRVVERCAELLRPYFRGDFSEELYATERANMPTLGYGAKAFTISLIETAARVSRPQLPGVITEELIALGKGLLAMPVGPLPGVERTLEACAARWPLALYTKGELLDQQNKIARSGLGRHFRHVEIVSSKSADGVRSLCRAMGVRPERLCMVGNSFRSDIAPAIEAGCMAVYIPFHTTWQLEAAEEYDHERLVRLDNIGQLPATLGI